MHEFLNQSELQALERLNADFYGMQALKKVILHRIYYHGIIDGGILAEPLKNFMLNILDSAGKELTNAELGSLVRIKRIAVELLEEGVKDIEKYKRLSPPKPKEVDYR